jgi:hypothetical protein
MAVEKNRDRGAVVSTALEVTGLLFVFGGLATWSVPLAFIVTGVLFIIAGGLAA